jgi:hypothetical protein
MDCPGTQRFRIEPGIKVRIGRLGKVFLTAMARIFRILNLAEALLR